MRLEITRKTDLALRAICALDRAGRLKGPDIAAAVGTTRGFVAQVMNPLVQRGWVRSDPGPTGGYELVGSLEGTSMLELIETVEGPTDDGRCVLRGGPCPGMEVCALHDAWVPAREALLARLAGVSLAEAVGCTEVKT